MAFEITPAHEAIFAAVKDGSRNIQVEAVAGSGKTSTLVEAARLLPRDDTAIFLAFNKSIAVELGRRLPRHVEARTMNSLGHRAWTDHLMDSGIIRSRNLLRLDSRKSWLVLDELCDSGEYNETEKKTLGLKAVHMVSIAKGHGMKPGEPDGLIADSFDAWWYIVDHFGIDAPENERDAVTMIEMARSILVASASGRWLTTIDFNDQLWLPYIFDIRPRTYDRVIVDEAQDLSPLQHDLIGRTVRGGHLIAVGDPCQAIYGFRGADSSSMATMRNAFDMDSLPLHVSYRCPRLVVAKAQTVVGHIQAHKDAPDGVCDEKVLTVDAANLQPGDLVVCRTNAPGLRLAFNLIKRGKRAEVLGRDIGKNLTSLINKLRPRSASQLLDRLDGWERKECEKLTKRKAAPSAFAIINDKAECIRAIVDGIQGDSIQQVSLQINALFEGEPSGNAVTIASIHKSKGLEANRVWVLNPELMPHRMAKKPWEMEQERNLMYVAWTRAKAELRFLSIE